MVYGIYVGMEFVGMNTEVCMFVCRNVCMYTESCLCVCVYIVNWVVFGVWVLIAQLGERKTEVEKH